MVALKTPRAPRPSCDRYGHPVCAGSDTSYRSELLRGYLAAHESEVADRWTSLYRRIYPGPESAIGDEQLVPAVMDALRFLEDGDDHGTGPLTPQDEDSRRLLKQVCLAGFECHGCLVPRSDWADERSHQEAREQLRRQLFTIVDRLLP